MKETAANGYRMLCGTHVLGACLVLGAATTQTSIARTGRRMDPAPHGLVVRRVRG
jgi:hypothetical protein